MNTHYYRRFRHGIPKLRLLIMLISALLVCGCNTARYGCRHDELLPTIHSVEIRPVDIKVVSLHAGGMTEDRPDILREVWPRLMQEFNTTVSKKQVRVYISNENLNESKLADELSEAEALFRAVCAAITTHHYLYGESRMIDYSLGEAIGRLQDHNCDAVLLVSLQAAVPTGGRVGLAVTAALVQVATGIQFNVSTNEALLELMLVHAQTGEVLWYNRLWEQTDVRSKSGLKGLVKDACDYLLKPLQKKRG